MTMSRMLCLGTTSLLALAACASPVPPPSSPEDVEVAAARSTSSPHGYFRQPEPLERRCLERPFQGVPPRSDIGSTPCTVTANNVTVLLGALQTTLTLNMNVTQPADGPPTGTVLFSQTIREPFNLRSETITSVVCDVNFALVTGTLFGGGNFWLAITHQALTYEVQFATPYYVGGGPAIEGLIEIDVLPGETGDKQRQAKLLQLICPPNRHLFKDTLFQSGPARPAPPRHLSIPARTPSPAAAGRAPSAP